MYNNDIFVTIKTRKNKSLFSSFVHFPVKLVVNNTLELFGLNDLYAGISTTTEPLN